jgi:hypothetical protein
MKIRIIEGNKLAHTAFIMHVYFHRGAPLRCHFKVDRTRIRVVEQLITELVTVLI